MSFSVFRVKIIISTMILYLFSIFPSAITNETLISLRVYENLSSGTIICQLNNLIIPRPNKNTHFTMIKNKFFGIEGKDKLVVVGLIDRDDNSELCVGRNGTCSCLWRQFLISSTGLYYILEICILDENDNIPHWFYESFLIEVTENTRVDSFNLELQKAKDSDEFPNNINSYKIEPTSKYFDIISEKSHGSIKPFLKLKRLLDRELISWHNITILAVDGGSPSNTGTLSLFVKILDVNDNFPIFESSIYSHLIDNNCEVNSTLDLKIRATDLDSGINGNVTYRFSLDVPFIVQRCFDINPFTAVITIKILLKSECFASEYRFDVLASDQGVPQRTSKTSVILQLKNQNLHPPIISLSANDPNIYLSENEEIGHFLISAAVRDKDSDKNGEFYCQLLGLNDNEIILRTNKTQNEDLTIIYLITNTIFDREQISNIHVTIVCQDLGEPPLQARKDIYIFIKDVNDNSPKFENESYYFKIYEENRPNERIAQLISQDSDSGENARLRYRIEWLNGKYNATELIKVDASCQIIAAQALDREKYPDGFQFQIIATDYGEPPRSGSTMVHIVLQDINDHSPVFERQFYNLSFLEDSGSKQKQRVVSIFKATDADLSENGIVTYSIVSDSLLPFKLHPHTGELYSFILVDRETQPTQYSFTILATDSPHNLLYKKTSTVSVFVKIEDLNDNEPIFTFPSEANFKVQLSYLVPVGTVVTTVKAFDKDAGVNSQIVFSLVDAERNILFSINESTGQLVTATVLNAVHEGSENLFIRASDCGTPRLTTIQSITITIGEFRTVDPSQTNDNDNYGDPFLSDQATFIVVGIILGTFFVCCGLVTGICTMAYRRWNHTNRQTNVPHYQAGEELTNLQHIDNYLIMKEFA